MEEIRVIPFTFVLTVIAFSIGLSQGDEAGVNVNPENVVKVRRQCAGMVRRTAEKLQQPTRSSSSSVVVVVAVVAIAVVVYLLGNGA